MSSIEGLEELEVFIGLGSNQDSPEHQLIRAVTRLSEELELTRLSACYDSSPFEAPPQPDFLNAVAGFRAANEPEALLTLCKRIEQEHDRTEGAFRGPRTLDLDILLFGKRTVDSAPLRLPHMDLHRRRFVLAPMVEIAPEVKHPVFGLTMRELFDQCEDAGPVRRREAGGACWSMLVARSRLACGRVEPVA